MPPSYSASGFPLLQTKVCKQSQKFFMAMVLLSGLSVCHSLCKSHPRPGWSHPKPSHCWLNPTHRKHMCLPVFQQRSSRGERLLILLAFELHLDLVELHKTSSWPDQVHPALLHATNATRSITHVRLKVSTFTLSSECMTIVTDPISHQRCGHAWHSL